MMGCGASREGTAADETEVLLPTVPDDPKPVVEEVDSEQEDESELRAIHEVIVARGPNALALGPPAIVGAEDCMALNGLPECLSDLHDGMPPAIQQAAMRLLKIKSVLAWKLLKVYEEVDADTECLQVPYKETDDDLWKRVVTISWRWAEQKPEAYKKDFSPMSDSQFIELSALVRFSEEKGIDYVWIDWSCVPQYAEDSMVEVHRSKVFYARSRAMHVLPTFRQLPAEGPVRLILVRARKVLTKRADAGSVRCATAAAIVAAILDKNLVAGREYFGRVWTLAERMARFGRNEGLCQWLSLESWLGMVVDAMLKSSEDKMSSVIYKKMLGQKAAGLLDAVLAPLSAAVRSGSVQARAAEGLETKVAELCMAAVKVWLSPSLLAEAPTSNWLHTYLGEEARSGVYQAWCEADRVWAVYSYFCWKQNLDQRSAEGLRIALEDLVEIASGDRSVYVKGMFMQLGVDGNATSVMEIVPQPGKQAAEPARPASARSTPVRPPSARPPSARTQEEIGRRTKEEEAAAAARERRRQEEEALTASLEQKRHEMELAADAASERRKQEEEATLAATERRMQELRKLEEEMVAAAVTIRREEEKKRSVQEYHRLNEEDMAAAVMARKAREEAGAPPLDPSAGDLFSRLIVALQQRGQTPDAAFSEYNRDGCGKLSRAELTQLIMAHLPDASSMDVKHFQAMLYTDALHAGEEQLLSRQEFVEGLPESARIHEQVRAGRDDDVVARRLQRNLAINYDVLREVFGELGENADGHLDHTELQEVIVLIFHMRDDEKKFVLAVLYVHDANRDLRMSLDELMAAVTQYMVKASGSGGGGPAHTVAQSASIPPPPEEPAAPAPAAPRPAADGAAIAPPGEQQEAAAAAAAAMPPLSPPDTLLSPLGS